MKLTIVKVGGKIVEDPASLKQLLKDFSAIEGYKLLVHGGGRSATKVATQLGVETHMVDGRRITDKAMLDVVTMVYAGLVNKNIVAGLQAIGLDALGVTGADLNLIRSDKRPVKEVDYGFVGDVRQVHDKRLAQLVEMGILPVIAPLTHDGKGNMLNTNADTMAGETAKAAAKHFDVRLVFCFEKPGVLRNADDDTSVIPIVSSSDYPRLKEEGVVSGGMIPKLDNAFEAIAAGVNEVIITQATDLQGIHGTLLKL